MTSDNTKSFRYIPGLDGLRALAVLTVIAYHLNAPFSTGGFLGVTVFFVLSGFLITSLLAWEWGNTGSIDLKYFWIRRAKRLLPAMFLLLIVLNVFIPLFRPELITSLQKDSIAAFFYYSNWHYIFQEIPYFEAFGTASLLTHFWSLAIEEQFYIFWAVIILFLFKFIKNRIILFTFIMIIAGLSAAWMMMLYDPNLDPSRVYYGTDTRMFSLLIGASFALIYYHQSFTNHSSKAKKWFFEIAGMIGILAFLLMVVYTNQYESFTYRGGMVLLSIVTALCVLSLSMPSTVIINKILGLKVLKWIGVRSYGIYLWHFPIIVLTNSNVNTGGIDYIKVTIQLTLTFLISALSYRYVEKPIRQGKIRFTIKNSIAITTTVCILIIGANSIAKFEAKNDIAVAYNGEASHQPIEKSMKEAALFKQEENRINIETMPVNTVKNEKMTAIGDSVLVNPTPFLKEKFQNILVDAKVSRQMQDALSIVNKLKKANNLGNIVIIELGTNGPFPDEVLIKLLNSIGKDRKVFLVNVRVPRPWESVVNETIAKVSKKYSNTTIVDWYSTSANHNEYFTSDGVHLNSKGAEAFADMIEKSVQNVKVVSN